MLDEAIRNKVWKIAESYYPKNDWAHGRSHIERVIRSAVEIGKQEGADIEVIELAAILHDIFVKYEYNIQHREAHSRADGFRHEIEAAKESRRILGKLGISDATIDAVAHCIEAHRKRSSSEPQTIEAKCLFDADKLDCIGAIGVIRSAFVSFEHGQEFYKEETDIEAYERKNVRSDGTIIDFRLHSSNLEYELSLKEVAKRMHTKTGRRLSEGRAAFMDAFYERFAEELKGRL